jgi:ankyrin repeat protein
LVAAGADVNDAAPDGNSALVLAAYSGHGDVAEFLLGKDANPNATGAGYTALHAAVLRGDLGLVTALLAHGANPNVHLTKGTPVLHQNVDLHLREALLGATPFFLAAKFLEGDMMRALVAAGADARLGVKDGTTPLMAATGVGWKGGSVTRRDTVSFFAAVRPDEDRVLAAVKLMLDLGADVNASNQNGDTALHGAASHGYTAVTQLLVDHGAKLDVKNKRGQAPSDIAPKKR